MKESIVGTGLTKRVRRTVSSKDTDAADRMHEFAQKEHWGYDGAARGTVENLAKTLEKSGLPYLNKTIVIEGGQWRYLRDGEKEIDLPRPSRTTGLCKYLEDEFGYQSFELYAGRIIELSHQALEDQNIPAAIELGYLMHQLKFKQKDEGLAISRLDSTAALKESSANDERAFVAAEWYSEARAAAQRIRERKPYLSKRRVAELVRAELTKQDPTFGKSTRTIRGVI